MTCDKCYHNEVCSALYEMNGVPRIGASECAYFKDKARVVEVVPVENFMGNMHGDPVGEPGESGCKWCRAAIIDEFCKRFDRAIAESLLITGQADVHAVANDTAEKMKKEVHHDA